jgi:hypothetical protein
LTEEGPREAVEATLGLLAEELEGTGFSFAPGLVLRRKAGDLTQTIRAQTDKHNKTGVLARFSLTAWLESAALGAWMKQRYPDRPPSRFVTARQLKSPGTPHHAGWDVVDQAIRRSVAAEAAQIVRVDILPWFEMVSDPAAALSTVLEEPWSPAIIPYAVATGHSATARQRVAELCEKNPAFRNTLERLHRDGKPAAYRDGLEPIAWNAIEAGVA